MEFKKCSRCGSFYLSDGVVCPKCNKKDSLEFSNFKNYISKNGFDNSLDSISAQTGISVKNLNRFIEYPEFKQYKQDYQKKSEGHSKEIL